MTVLFLACLILVLDVNCQDQKKVLKIPDLAKKDTDIQILHQLLLDEKKSRGTLEKDLAAMKVELSNLKAGYSTQNQNIQELTAQNRKLKSALKKQESNSVSNSKMKGFESLMTGFARNFTDVVEKMQTLSQFLTYVEGGNAKVNLTMQEVLGKLEVLARNLTSVNIVIKSYLGPMLTSTMNLNNSFARLKTQQDTMLLRMDKVRGDKIGFYAYSYNAVKKWPGSDTIVFEKIVTNAGNAYNASNGVVTAPSKGLYVFLWTMTTFEGNSFEAHLMKNGNDVKYLYINGGVSGGYETGSTSALLELKKGDNVYIRGGNGGRLEYPNIVFTGFKL